MRAKYVEIHPEVLESLLKTRDVHGIKRIVSNLPDDARLYQITKIRRDGIQPDNYLFFFRSESWEDVDDDDVGPFEAFVSLEYEDRP